MCGVFGHEREHVEESKGVFDMSWRPKLQAQERAPDVVCATGHSCRSQIERYGGFVPRHPIQVLAQAMRPSQQKRANSGPRGPGGRGLNSPAGAPPGAARG
jgi:Fe-S oxidoreductase